MEEEGDRRSWGSQPPHKHQQDTSDANTGLWLVFTILCGPRTTQEQRKRPRIHCPFLGDLFILFKFKSHLSQDRVKDTGWKVVAERSPLCH